MPNLSSSVASSSSAHQSRHRSHRPSRSQLEKNLQILARAPEPLPASLPSPPPSRGASPPDLPASLKRKLDHSYPQESSSKRSRPSDIQPPPPPPPPRRQAYALRSDPVEEGELPDDLPSPQLSSSRPSQPPPPASPLTSLSTPFLPAIANIPIARPRKRLRRDDPTFLQLYERYFKYGKILKYSSDCHYLASFPPSHKDYKPLANPPPPTDAYHQRSALMGRLEGVDAMMCFAYSLWAKDYTQNSCNFESWRSLNSFMASTKSRWTMDNTSELDRAFLGLIWMVEGFIQSRVLSYLQKETGPEFDRLQRKSEQILAHAQAPKPPAPSVQAAAQQRTPPMLPSPASIAPASSANSTPTGRDAETPNSSAASPAVRPPAPSSSSVAGPRPPAIDKAAIAVPISAHFSDRLQMMNKTFGDARLSMKYAQMHLTLRTLAAHFPETFQRILQSSLRQEDEPEPDIEDDAGELFWPGAPTTGEGIGWVCLMGKAMINEFGKTIGYRGYDGCVPKPGDSNVPAASSAATGDRR